MLIYRCILTTYDLNTLVYKLTANLHKYFFIVDIITVKLRNVEEIR